MRELQEMQGEFAQASDLMDQKYKQLNEKFMELQELYEGRPSRPEDLDMIKQLQEEIV
jgi:DNA repair ATPase RecN